MSSLCVNNFFLFIKRRKKYRLKAPTRNIMIGRPAKIFVERSAMKYPTTVGILLPRISSPALGLANISVADFHKEPAVTVI